MNELAKPIFYLLAMIAAFVFTYFTGLGGAETFIVPILGTLASVFGITKWRSNFDAFEGYFKSKTVLGSLLTAVPILVIVVVVHIVHVEMAQWLQYILDGILAIGGGTFLLGLLDALFKADPAKRLKKAA